MTDGLFCTCSMPLAWSPADLDAQARHGLLREATLLLGAFNQMEGGHELESPGPENRRLERLEAKLDLALFLLARALEPGPAPAPHQVTLTPTTLAWNEATAPAAGSSLVLELRPSESLPLTLRLPALAEAAPPGQALARLEALPEDLVDALYQFVFRRHRQEIRARAGG